MSFYLSISSTERFTISSSQEIGLDGSKTGIAPVP